MISRFALVLVPILAIGCKRSKSQPIEKDPTPPPSVSAAPSIEPLAPPKDCPADMAALPGGAFKMFIIGYHVPIYDKDLQPAEVKPFCLDKLEVTVEAYETCVKAGQCTEPFAYDPKPEIASQKLMNWKHPDPARRKHPVNGVQWHQAETYCKFMKRRLPVEEEIEWAMRNGTQATKYPWGNQPIDATRANLGDKSWWDVCVSVGDCAPSLTIPPGHWSDGFPFTAPVGSFPAGANRWGVHDLVGNIQEWTASRTNDGLGEGAWARGGHFGTSPALSGYFDDCLAQAKYGMIIYPADKPYPNSWDGIRCAR